MELRELSVAGAYRFGPTVHRDHRGGFVTVYPPESTKGLHFPVAQVSHSTSHSGVVRGVHYTRTPPGCAKLVWCSHGEVVDFVVDLRVGSPTFGQWDQVILNGADGAAVYLPVGVGHAYLVRRDETVVTYLLSQRYSPQDEIGISVRDPEVGLPLPPTAELVLSERDSAAPTLAEAHAAGVLPHMSASVELDEVLRG